MSAAATTTARAEKGADDQRENSKQVLTKRMDVPGQDESTEKCLTSVTPSQIAAWGSVERNPADPGSGTCQLLPGRSFGSGLSVTSIR